MRLQNNLRLLISVLIVMLCSSCTKDNRAIEIVLQREGWVAIGGEDVALDIAQQRFAQMLMNRNDSPIPTLVVPERIECYELDQAVRMCANAGFVGVNLESEADPKLQVPIMFLGVLSMRDFALAPCDDQRDDGKSYPARASVRREDGAVIEFLSYHLLMGNDVLILPVKPHQRIILSYEGAASAISVMRFVESSQTAATQVMWLGVDDSRQMQMTFDFARLKATVEMLDGLLKFHQTISEAFSESSISKISEKFLMLDKWRVDADEFLRFHQGRFDLIFRLRREKQNVAVCFFEGYSLSQIKSEFEVLKLNGDGTPHAEGLIMYDGYPSFSKLVERFPRLILPLRSLGLPARATQ